MLSRTSLLGGPMDLIYPLFVLLLLGSAFFSGSETAVFSLDLLQRTRLFRSRRPAALRLKRLYLRPSDTLMTILIGNMLVNIALSSVASGLFQNARLLGIAVITMALLVFGEITPKNMAFAYNRSFSLFASLPLSLVFRLLSPVRRLLDFLTRPFITRYSGITERKVVLTVDEIKTAVLHGHRTGVLDVDESDLISNVLTFSIKEARHVMTPRTRILALPQRTPLRKAIAFARERELSKIPLYKKNKDHIMGYLAVKDLLPYVRGVKKATGISHLMRPVLYIPEGKQLAEFVRELKDTTSRMAVVLDEFGGTAGIITLDDVLEEILGQFLDEGETMERFYWQDAQGKLIFRGSAPLEVFNEQTGMDIQSQDYETLSGYLMDLAGDIPHTGDELRDGRLVYRIRLMKRHHISQVEVAQQ